MAHKGTEKTLEKLKTSVANGNYYEAHQIYRTIARRYNKQQKYAKAIQLLHDGAVTLMQHEQYASGSDLANYMLDTYNAAQVPVDEKSLDRVVELLGLYPANEPGRKAFIHNAFSWTQKHGSYPEGDPELHDYVGTLFFHEERYGPAEEHLVVGTDHSADLVGLVAARWAKAENAPMPGVFIARVVLQLLAMKNIHHANLALTRFLKESNPETGNDPVQVRLAPAEPPVQNPVYTDSWLNFTQLVLLTVQRDAADLYRQLRSSYADLYREQKGFDDLLDDIGAVFFNIPKPRKQSNMLQDLMNSLFAAAPSQRSQGSSSSNMELD